MFEMIVNVKVYVNFFMKTCFYLKLTLQEEKPKSN